MISEHSNQTLPSEAGRRMVLPKGQRSMVVTTADIEWIEADDCYANVHAPGGPYLIRKSLDLFEHELDPRMFARAHRSAIVNLEHVVELRRRGAALVAVLRSGTEIVIGQRRRRDVMQRLLSAGGAA
jgi:two-component system, LytTR family, response regulator